MDRHKLGALLVSHLPNVRYLCGFTGSSGVLALVAGKRPVLTFFTDGRYTEQASQEVVGTRVSVTSVGPLKSAAEWLQKAPRGPQVVGFEAEHTSVAARDALAACFPKSTKLRPVAPLVERLRMVKEEAEIRQIRAAVNLASGVYDSVVGDITPGVLESSIAAELEYMCRRMGAEGMSFETIVASGQRSALPHGKAANTAVAANGFVIIDFGVILGGYCSDMTRTVHVGAPKARSRRIYSAVLRAQLAGIKAVKAGIETVKVDQAARDVLEKEGLGAYFTHSTGHGVGLEIHEAPGLRRRPTGRSQTKSGKVERLEAGMVVTIEPGVYLPGQGGVRIEDMVLVTESGCEVLTPNPKELIVL